MCFECVLTCVSCGIALPTIEAKTQKAQKSVFRSREHMLKQCLLDVA